MTNDNDCVGKKRQAGLAERIYLALKNDIFDFRLMPGEHFSENEISERMAASRTPVRQALFWLEREGYVEVFFRSGWQRKTQALDEEFPAASFTAPGTSSI